MFKISRPLKIVIIGDKGTGKTKLVRQFMEQTFSNDQEEELAELHHSTIIQDGKTLPIIIYDTPGGQEGSTNQHKNMYSNADVILLCFDVCNRKTLASVQERWIPELQSSGCAKQYQFMLVGLKNDDRTRHQLHDSRRSRQGNTVSPENGVKAHREINSCVYLECSAKTGDGVKKVFEVASLLASQRKAQRKSWFVKFTKWNSVSMQQT